MTVRDWFLIHIPRLFRTSEGLCVVKTVLGPHRLPVRVMQIGGVYQSATYFNERRLEPVFSYYRSFDLAFDYCHSGARALMIGGGGYAWPKHVLAGGRDLHRFDIVELDPVITKIARKYFFLDEALALNPGVVHLIADDGRSYLERYDNQPYDCIVLDAFSGSEPVGSLSTCEFASLARGCLTKDGAILANVVSEEAGADISFLRNLAASFATAFKHVYAVPCDEDPFAVEDNYLLVATDSGIVPRGGIPFDEETLGMPLHDFSD